MKLIGTMRRRLGMPLLAKELVEQANRRRTYVIRTAYAALLFAAACLVIYEELYRRSVSPVDLLGRGQNLFEALVGIQFAGIYLFLPAVMAGAITQEKERNSLALLVVTDLRPWQILLQKYFGRLVPMLTFLLLSLPLMAVSYSLGGVTTDRLCSAILLLTLCCLQVGAICLMLSAFCGATSTAFVLTYVLGACFYFGPVLVAGILHELHMARWIRPEPFLSHVPPFVFYELGSDLVKAALWSIPIAVSTLAFLLLARLFLLRRAFLIPRNPMLAVFRALDRFYEATNIGGIVFMRHTASLPDDKPVAWWEVTRRALGQPLYLFRILAAVMVPTFLVIGMVMTNGQYRHQSEALSAMLFLIWPVAVLLLAVQGASTFALDRARQRLDVLLVAPIRSTELVRQKTAALRRLILVWCVPLLMIVGFEAWWEHGTSRNSYGGFGATHTQVIYVVCSLLSVAIYLPLIAWLSMWIGMKVKSQTKAIMIAVASIVAWCAIPPAVVITLLEMFRVRNDALMPLMLLSPASIVPLNEFAALDELEVIRPWTAVAWNFVLYAAALHLFRYLCLARANRYLGRA